MERKFRRIISVLLFICMITGCLAGCGGSAVNTAGNQPVTEVSVEAAVAEQSDSVESRNEAVSVQSDAADDQDNVVSIWQQETEDQLEKELGAFDITAHQREIAKTNEAGYSVLDAGRGNPNWINTQARYAFTRLMNWAVSESELTFHNGSMAGQAEQEGICGRFDDAMDPEDETDAFLITAIDYCVNTLGMDKDVLLKELADAVIGDYYPNPSRCLPCTETILNAYLQSALYNGADLAGETQIFPTEGGARLWSIFLGASAITAS